MSIGDVCQSQAYHPCLGFPFGSRLSLASFRSPETVSAVRGEMAVLKIFGLFWIVFGLANGKEVFTFLLMFS